VLRDIRDSIDDQPSTIQAMIEAALGRQVRMTNQCDVMWRGLVPDGCWICSGMPAESGATC